MQNFRALGAVPPDPLGLRRLGAPLLDPQNSPLIVNFWLRAWFNPHPSHVVASLDKTLYDDYLCLVASNKQQIQWTRIRKNPEEHWITGNSQAGVDSSKHKVVVIMKSVRIVQ